MKLLIQSVDGSIMDFTNGYIYVLGDSLKFSYVMNDVEIFILARGTMSEMESLQASITAWLMHPTKQRMELPVWVIPVPELLDIIRGG